MSVRDPDYDHIIERNEVDDWPVDVVEYVMQHYIDHAKQGYTLLAFDICSRHDFLNCYERRFSKRQRTLCDKARAAGIKRLEDEVITIGEKGYKIDKSRLPALQHQLRQHGHIDRSNERAEYVHLKGDTPGERLNEVIHLRAQGYLQTDQARDLLNAIVSEAETIEYPQLIEQVSKLSQALENQEQQNKALKLQLSAGGDTPEQNDQ